MKAVETITEANQRYLAAAHAMQSGVAGTLQLVGDSSASPKHLRVGVNSAMSNMAGIARLLIEKKVITELEYAVAIADEMEREKERFEAQLTKALGRPVKLA